MSVAGKFGDSSHSRVAHRPVGSSTNPTVLKALEAKKQSLAQIAARVNAGSAKAVPHLSAKVKKSTGHKKQKTEWDSEEEEFIDDVEQSEEEEDFELSDEEERRRKKPKKGTASRGASGSKSVPTRNLPKDTRLSDSENEEEWLCKPRLNGSNDETSKVMQTLSPEKKKKTRRLVLSESSDDEQSKPASTLKNVAKEAAKFKKTQKAVSDDEWNEDEGDDVSDRGESTPSSDSDADERRPKRRENELSRKCREFFNAATKEEIILTPRITDKMVQVIIEQRPFSHFSELESALIGVRGGKGALDAYLEYLENRGVLELILDDCKDHAMAVEQAFGRCSENLFQPAALAPGFKLHNYQKIGLNWLIMMYNKGFNCILGDEMGLGKTIQIVAFLTWLKEKGVNGPHLVVVPSSTVENWMSEISKWSPTLSLLTYYGSQDDRKQLRHMAKKGKKTIDVILTTYNMIASKHDDKKFFKNFSMNYVIYDEGHMLKNCGTDRYKNLMKVKGQRKILLTGTPLQNNLIELISLMYFVMTKIFTKYCEEIGQLLSHFKQQGPALDTSSSLAMYQKDRIEQAKAILQPYILRRLKSQVLDSLPEKLEQVVEVEMLKDQSDLYETVLDGVRGANGDTSNAYGALMRLRQAANHPLLQRKIFDDLKIDRLAKTLVAKESSYERKQWEHVAEDLAYMSDFQLHQLAEKHTSTCNKKFLLDETMALESGKCRELDKRLPEIKKKGDKVLIFSQFTSALDILEVYMRVRGHSFRRLDGQTPVLERQEMINEFNNSSELFVFLLSTRAGGLGINLTSANHIIIHDIDFNPYNDKQAEDRCHRMGQLKKVYVTKLISKGTVETGMHSLAKKKLQLEKAVTGGIKGQIEEDDEDSRGSSSTPAGSKEEEKLDGNTLQQLLSGALEHKGLANNDTD